MKSNTYCVVAWWNPEQRDKFLAAWGIGAAIPDWLILQQDKDKEGCARTKNKGLEEARWRGAEVVVVLDDDCLPLLLPYMHDVSDLSADQLNQNLPQFIAAHGRALEPQLVERFKVITNPRSRGTPHKEENRCIRMPVAISYGMWVEVGDYDAVMQLAYGATYPMTFDRRPVWGQYVAGSGMNMAFNIREWHQESQFINVSRFDDIWQSLIWQRIAYDRGYCLNFGGPLVRHSRQSNVWQNLRDEAKYLEENETLWQKILAAPSNDYDELRKLLPI